MKGFQPDNAPRLLPEDTDSWYQVRIGLPRADWTKIREWIDGRTTEDQRDLAWRQAACDWLERLGDALGGGHVVHESPVFLMLMSGADEQVERMLRLLEDERRRVCRRLGKAAPEDYLGKPVAIVLASDPEFYSYIADYHPPEGRFASPGAVFVRAGYGHIVLPARNPNQLRERVAHETVHNCLMRLPLPQWLDEGLAVTLSGSPCSFDDWHPQDGDLHSAETLARCRRHWNSATIQQFWSGRSFRQCDDLQSEVPIHFSYILAAELTRRLSRRKRFEDFVLAANWQDAGLAAAADVLGVDLAQEVAEFLGPGDWKPRPETWDSDA